MSESKKQSGLSSLMPQQWLAVLLFVAGLAAVKLSSLESPRPPVETTAVEPKDGKFKLSNLEDPSVILTKPAHQPQQSQGSPNENPKKPESATEKHHFKFPEPRPWQEKSEFRLFMVFMKAPSDAAFEDIRQTDRQAIASALSARHYIPSENRSLRLCDHAIMQGKERKAVGVKIPYEWWHHSKAENQVELATEEPPVLVLWLDSEKFVPELTNKLKDEPRSCLHELSQIVDLVACDLLKSASKVDIFGPNDTDSLVRIMVSEELARHPERGIGFQRPIFSDSQGLSFLSAMCTAQDTIIIDEVHRKLERDYNYKKGPLVHREVADEMNRYLGLSNDPRPSQGGFRRTIATDDQVAERLVDELVSRGVGDRVKAKKGSLLLISEVDTLYGRMLPEAFRNAWNDKTGSIDGSRIKVLTYFKGLDGRYSKNTTAAAADDAGGDAAKKGIGGTQTQVGSNGTSASYPPRGIAQSDALRRMGFEMRYTDDELDDVIAVGILGTDVFDKLLVIRALRPVMKDAFFFTNNLDAWMWDQKEIETTRGMIAAAPAGIELGDIITGQTDIQDSPLHMLPFRNSYQSVLFRTAYLAIDSNVSRSSKAQDPCLFEIDSSGPVRIEGKSWKWVGTLVLVPPVIALILGPIPLIIIFSRTRLFKKQINRIKTSREIGVFLWWLLGLVTLGVAFASPPPVLVVGWCWTLVAIAASVSWRSKRLLKFGKRWMMPGLVVPAFILFVSILEISFFLGNKRGVFFGNRTGAWFYLSMISLGVLLASLGLWWLHETWIAWRRKPDDVSGYDKYNIKNLKIRRDIANLKTKKSPTNDVVWFEEIFDPQHLCFKTWKFFAYMLGMIVVVWIAVIANMYQPHFQALRTHEIDFWPGPYPESCVVVASVILHSILWVASFVILAAYHEMLSEVNNRETQWEKNVEKAVLPEFGSNDVRGNEEWMTGAWFLVPVKPNGAGAIKKEEQGSERFKNDCIDLHYLADRTRGWSAMLAAPFLTLLPLAASTLMMDMAPRWSWPVVTIMVLGSAAVVAMGYVCHSKLMRMREDVVREIQTVAGLPTESVKALTGSLLGLEHGLFRPFSQQPVVRLFVFAVALISTREIWEAIQRH